MSRAPYRLDPEPVRDESRAYVCGPRGRSRQLHRSGCVGAAGTELFGGPASWALTAYRDLLATGPSVLLGDFNSSVAWDTKHGRADHRELEHQLREEFGLVSAYHASTGEQPGSESQSTHFWRWQEASPFHLDYCYLPEAWVPGLRSVRVGRYDEWADGLSDHRPVIVDVSPPPSFARAAV